MSFRASDSIWVYFDGTLLTSHQGSFYFCCLSHRVGINAEERIDLSQHVAALSRPYYSLHVFAASRSCVTNSSLFSAFHWTTSTPAMPALEDHLNHHVTMTPDNTDSVDVTWAGGTATLQANSSCACSSLRRRSTAWRRSCRFAPSRRRASCAWWCTACGPRDRPCCAPAWTWEACRRRRAR